jgi:hypothetical protein
MDERRRRSSVKGDVMMMRTQDEMMETRRTERRDEWKRTRGGDAKRRR